MKHHNNTAAPKLTLANLAQAFTLHQAENASRFATLENSLGIMNDTIQRAMADFANGQDKLLALVMQVDRSKPSVSEPSAVVAEDAQRVEAIVKEAPKVPDLMTDERIVEVLQDVASNAVNIQSVMAWLPTATREELKQVRQWLGTEALGHREKTPAAKTNAEREQCKTAYESKKAVYANRPFGIRCVTTGKELKRRFNDLSVAAAQATDLTRTMRREYVAFSVRL